jgi:hypothetical protein
VSLSFTVGILSFHVGVGMLKAFKRSQKRVKERSGEEDLEAVE